MKLFNLLKQPIIGFILTGLILFIADQHFNQSTSTIHFTNADASRLRDQWQAQSSIVFSDDVLLKLLYKEAQEKRLFLEAKALGLDQGDIIIQRRLVQKLKFINEDITILTEPTEKQIQNYYQQNINLYSTPIQYSFQQIYFNPTNHSFNQTNFKKILKDLEKSQPSPNQNLSWMNYGDPFLLGQEFNKQSRQQLTIKFGKKFPLELSSQHKHLDWPNRIGFWHAFN